MNISDYNNNNLFYTKKNLNILNIFEEINNLNFFVLLNKDYELKNKLFEKLKNNVFYSSNEINAKIIRFDIEVFIITKNTNNNIDINKLIDYGAKVFIIDENINSLKYIKHDLYNFDLFSIKNNIKKF